MDMILEMVNKIMVMVKAMVKAMSTDENSLRIQNKIAQRQILLFDLQNFTNHKLIDSEYLNDRESIYNLICLEG